MRWKIILVLILFVGLALVGGLAWFQWQSTQNAKRVDQQVALCKNQLAMGDVQRAQANLEKILAEHSRLKTADDIWALLAESYQTAGAADKSAQAWEKIRTEFPTSKHMDKAAGAYARRLYSQGKTKEAAAEWEKILATYKTSPVAADALLGKAQMLYDNQELVGARDLLRKALKDFKDSGSVSGIEELLGRINLELLYSRAPMEGDELIKIERGDKLVFLGRKYGVSPELLERVNHIRNIKMMPVGRRIKIPKTNFSLLVNKSDNTMALLNNGEFFKRYRVRTGKEDYMTPLGDFTVETKVKFPKWTNPEDGKFYPAGDPQNELGTRWMSFQGSIGIHGTIHPETVGRYASNGCVGMLTQDVEELYDLVPIGTPIKIIGKMKKGGQTVQKQQ